MEKTYKSGEVIFNEGDPGESFFEIRSGLVGVYTDYGLPSSNKLTEIGEGHILGEMALVDAGKRSATAVALSDVTVTEVKQDEVDEYFVSNSDRITFIARELCDRLCRLTDDYLEASTTLSDIISDEKGDEEGLKKRIQKFSDIYNMGKKYNQKSYEASVDKAPASLKRFFANKTQKYKKNTVIFKEGEQARGMYDIISGSVDIYTGYGTPEERMITTLKEGMFFGEIGMIADRMRTATAVIAENDTSLENILLEDFEELFKEDPEKIKSILKHLSYRIRTLTNDYMEACALMYEISEAGSIAACDEAIIEKVKKYKLKF